MAPLQERVKMEKGDTKTGTNMRIREIKRDYRSRIAEARREGVGTELAKEDIDKFSSEMGRSIGFGEFAENITTGGVDLGKVSVLDRFVIGDVELEVSQIGKKCHGDGCAIFREVGSCVMPKQGLFGRVVKGGSIRAGDRIEYSARPFRVSVLTMSDRAYAGEYSDRSGPKAAEMVKEFFCGLLKEGLFPEDLLRDILKRMVKLVNQVK